MKAEDWKSVAEYKLEINNLIETIFLLTLEKGQFHLKTVIRQ